MMIGTSLKVRTFRHTSMPSSPAGSDQKDQRHLAFVDFRHRRRPGRPPSGRQTLGAQVVEQQPAIRASSSTTRTSVGAPIMLGPPFAASGGSISMRAARPGVEVASIDATAMRAHDGLADRETEGAAAMMAISRGVLYGTAVQQSRQIVRRNARTLSSGSGAASALRLARRLRCGLAPRCSACCSATTEQLARSAQRPAHRSLPDHRAARSQRQARVFELSRACAAACWTICVASASAQNGGSAFRSAIASRCRVVPPARQADRLVTQRGDGLRAQGPDTIDHRLDISAQDRERCAQFVRDRRASDDVPPRCVAGFRPSY